MKRINFDKDFISLSDVYVAYRKAKADAFYQNILPAGIAFKDFEANLNLNLRNVYKKVTCAKPNWFADIEFIGSYLFIPKSLKPAERREGERAHFVALDPVEDWTLLHGTNNKKAKVELRLMIHATVEYQILSALWILKVGHQFEEKLDNSLSYGNRLRRSRSMAGVAGELNIQCLGFFVPYFSAYRNWRQKGLDAMKESVSKGENTAAITMDLASFYHNVSPNFLTRPSFIKQIGLEGVFSESQIIFTKQLVKSMHFWYQQTPDYSKRPEGALPVGLTASSIIANCLLYELDKSINEKLKPKYYGRYVDDIFLVTAVPANLKNDQAVIKWLRDQIKILSIEQQQRKKRKKRKKQSDSNLSLKLRYAKDSTLVFKAEKQKIFLFSSGHGLDLVEHISEQIKLQSSEYRLLPDIPTAIFRAVAVISMRPMVSLSQG